MDENANGGGRQNSMNPRAQQRVEAQSDAQNEMMLAMQMHRREMIEREKQMVMMTMMNSLMGQNGVEAEEERLLQ